MIWAKGQELQHGKYIIEEVLGQGGFGITYKALHVLFKQQVVIKTPNEYLKYERDYDQYVERFVREGRILARLSETPHPQIVGVRDLFLEDETHCLVMDFVPGMNLFDVVRERGALREGEAIEYIRQIGEALALVHQAGLVHRDAHPKNIMLRGNGTAVLIDFGIAKEIIPSTMSSTGDAGNRGFAPYEQLVRGSREPNVDIYCLAATLYYVVTGQPPPTSLDRKLNDIPLIPPKQIVPGICDRINQAILHGMALEPENRPHSIQDWLNYLDLDGDPIPPQPELGRKGLPILSIFNKIKLKGFILLFRVYRT
jgi:serine/threonine-protein kinase